MSLPDQGHPDSLICRWCNRAKELIKGFRLCTKCDAPDHTAATWQRP